MGRAPHFLFSAVAPSLAHMAVDAVPLFIRPTPALRLLRWLIRVFAVAVCCLALPVSCFALDQSLVFFSPNFDLKLQQKHTQSC